MKFRAPVRYLTTFNDEVMLDEVFERVVYDRGGGCFEIKSAELTKVERLNDGTFLNRVRVYGIK